MNITMEILPNNFMVDEKIKKLADIHADMYGIEPSSVIEALRNFDEIFLYTLNGEPIGNNCAKYIHIGEKLILYWGNAAFMKRFRYRRLLTESILYTDIESQRKWPDKEIYWSALTLTPISYSLVANLISRGWPRHGQKVPNHARELKKEVLEKHLRVNPIELENGAFLTDTLCQRLKRKLNFPMNNKRNHHREFFEDLNPKWREGYELFVIGPPTDIERLKLKAFVKYNSLKLKILDLFNPIEEDFKEAA